MTSEKLEREAIQALRRSYGEVGLPEFSKDPFELFHAWLKAAVETPVIVEANAMVLSTVDGNQPSSRTVLLKDLTDRFSFFTNYNSRKAGEMAKNPKVSLLFPWYAMERQVIVLGSAKKISAEASHEYFQSRPWGSQIGAWSSEQSADLDTREDSLLMQQEDVRTDKEKIQSDRQTLQAAFEELNKHGKQHIKLRDKNISD